MAAPDDVHAMAFVDEQWLAIERVGEDEVGAWRRAKISAHRHDPSLLGDHRQGERRQLYFRRAIELSTEDTVPGRPFQGGRVDIEYATALSLAGEEWLSHRLEFVEKSGVRRASGTARAHRRISKPLTYSMSFDQMNLANRAGIEYLTIFLVQIEAAVQHNLVVPDFSIGDAMLAVGVNSSGAAHVPNFSKYVIQIQRDEAQVLKQQRLWCEEHRVSLRPLSRDFSRAGTCKPGQASGDAGSRCARGTAQLGPTGPLRKLGDMTSRHIWTEISQKYMHGHAASRTLGKHRNQTALSPAGASGMEAGPTHPPGPGSRGERKDSAGSARQRSRVLLCRQPPTATACTTASARTQAATTPRSGATWHRQRQVWVGLFLWDRDGIPQVPAGRAN